MTSSILSLWSFSPLYCLSHLSPISFISKATIFYDSSEMSPKAAFPRWTWHFQQPCSLHSGQANSVIPCKENGLHGETEAWTSTLLLFDSPLSFFFFFCWAELRLSSNFSSLHTLCLGSIPQTPHTQSFCALINCVSSFCSAFVYSLTWLTSCLVLWTKQWPSPIMSEPQAPKVIAFVDRDLRE